MNEEQQTVSGADAQYVLGRAQLPLRPFAASLVESPGARGGPPSGDADPAEIAGDADDALRNLPRTRLFAAVHADHGYYVLVAARGPISALEDPTVRGAPVGALLLRDNDRGPGGLVLAERVSLGPSSDGTDLRAWVLRPEAFS